jgi:hypothetical protein
MNRSLKKLSLLIPLALSATLAACDSPTGPMRSAGDAQMAKANSTGVTQITISAPSVSAGQTATVSVTLWVQHEEGYFHPLGGKSITLFVDGLAYDAKGTSRLGTVDFKVTGLAAGTHALRAEFAGNNIYFGSTGSGSITVTP